MKKVLLFVLFAVVASGAVSAQSADTSVYIPMDNTTIVYKDISPAPLRAKYRNLSYSSQSLSFDGLIVPALDRSNWGVAFTTGRSYIVHKRPIARILHLGIDATWFDINYGNFGSGKGAASRLHKLDIGLGVGLGVHVTPVSKLGAHAYFRFNPTATAMGNNMFDEGWEVDAGYASYFTSGLAVSWGVISLGAEARFGGGKYKGFIAPDLDDLEDIIDDGGHLDLDLENGMFHKRRHTLRGYRVYVSFRF